MSTDAALFDLLSGNRQQLRAITAAFYRRVCADPLLTGFFAGVDMDRQSAMLAEFLALAFGGPHAYSGRDLRSAHASLSGLTDAHFDLVVGYLADTLADFGVSRSDTQTVAAVAETVRDEVLNR